MSQDGDDRSSRHQNPHVDGGTDEVLSSPPSNKKLLCIAFISFQSFAIVQLGAAIWAGSEAMLGDSIAMMVDSLAYLFNMIAERQKEQYATKLRQQYTSSSTLGITACKQAKMVLEYRKYTYQLELIPPLVSVLTLLVLTVIILKESIGTLIMDFQRDDSSEEDPSQSDPDVNIMVLFSCINLVLDFVNVGCFASASHGLGYKTHRDEDEDKIGGMGRAKQSALGDYRDKEDDGNNSFGDEDDDDVHNDFEKVITDDEPFPHPAQPYSDDPSQNRSSTHESLHSVSARDFIDNEVDDSTNLNMCSAYTHVFADTVRSFCVIIASLLAKFVTAISPEVADATAAVVVSILIFLSIFPLFGGMIQTFKSLKEVNCLLELKESDGKVEEDQVELQGLVDA